MTPESVIVWLAVLLAMVLALPFSVKRIEEELEAFLFVMGGLSVLIAGKASWALVREAAVEPIKIALAVLLVGFAFRAARARIRGVVVGLIGLLGLPAAVMAIVFALGLLSSVVTAIIASLVLAEVATALELDRKYELRMVVCACFAIGLGAALTPIGEPLATIAVAKLKGPPHDAGFFFLARLLGAWIAPGIAVCAFIAGARTGRHASASASLGEDRPERDRDIVIRAIKVYLFVMALVLLGAGLSPMAERTVAAAPGWAVYWINSVSAVVDNATLAAAEIVPSMSERTITFLLMGLLISGGMLIPGNIPNIVAASKLGIKSREWAAVAVPLGLALMTGYFAIMMLVL